MNGIVEIILLIAWCGVLGAAAVYLIGEEILARRYKKFYETTEEGKKLYYARYMLDLLKLRMCGFVRSQMRLKDKIDEHTTYMSDDNENREILRELKLQYSCDAAELKKIKQRIEDSEKRIEKMVVDLPKKYKGILKYNWENAKVEIEEVLVK